MIKSILLAVLVFLGGTGYATADAGAPDRIWLNEGPKPTAAQKVVECRYESQIARGLTSTMWLLAQAVGELPPKDFMKNYIAHFYDPRNNAESIAAASAAEVLNWLYLLTPPVEQSRAVEKAYYVDCMDGFPTYNQYRDEMIEKQSAMGVPTQKGEGVVHNLEEYI